jgi:two-component system, sensor histidine kinase ChiS
MSAAIVVLALAVAPLTAGDLRVAGGADNGGPSAAGGRLEVPSLAAPATLAGEWLFQRGDDLRWASPDFDDSGWERLQVPRGFGSQGHREHVGHWWYRLHVKAHAGANDQVSIRLRDVDSAYEIYADGVLLGGRGRLTAPYVAEQSHPAIWRVPQSALEDGEVVIAVRGYRVPWRADSNPARGGITHGPIFIGPSDVLARASVIEDLDEIALAAIFFVVALYHLHLFMRRRSLREYLWFGLFALLISLYVGLQTGVSADAVPFDLRGTISFTCIFLVMPVAVQFLWPFLGQRVRWWWRAHQVGCVSWAIVAAAWPTPWFTYKYLFVWEVVFMLPLLGGILLLIARRTWAGDPEARTIAIGMLALVATSVNNILRERSIYLAPEFTNYAFGVFVLSMAFSLSNRFTRVYKEVDEKNAELVKMDKLKDEFLANTSHELRTPIHGIIGIADSLIDGASGPLTPATIENLEVIVHSGERLSGLVDDILDFSKLNEGQVVIQPRAIDLRSTVDVVLRLSRPLADKKGLVLENAVPAELPAARADEHRLQQILFNLVGNGVKFTDQGSVRVEATASEGELTVTVIDTGIGIDPADHGRVFESFQQVDGSSARAYGGTGLGLAVAKRLVELHRHGGRGGVLSLSSEKGKGARFSFTLPTDAAGTAALAPVARPELVRRALELPELPAAAGDAATTLAQGIAPGPSTSVAVPRFAAHRFKVLVVDDEPVNVRVLENHLSLNDYEVAHAASGPEALALVENGFRPDVILLDVMMPRMSGFEVCQTLRARFPATELPVVLVTAKNQISDVVAGFEAGANDYLTKPIAKKELLARIRTHLHVAKMNSATARFVPFEFLSLLGKQTLIDVQKGDQIEKEMSILFSDIRSFTTLVEKNTPEENFAFINRYLEAMEPAILEAGGFVDSFIGDAVMALFGGKADDAVNAGIGMHRRLPAFNEDRRRRGEAPLKIGVGVNTGRLMLGTIGGSSHIKCGVIGDSVNLASRIEGMTKMYGASFLVSDDTRTRLEDPRRYTFREVDRVQAKGKNRPVTIYEVLDADEEPVRERKRRTLGRFEEGLALYRERRFADAEALFQELHAGALDDVIFALYAERAASFRAAPPPADWSAVEKLDSK